MISPFVFKSPTISSARGSAGSPWTVTSRYELRSLDTHCAVRSPGTLTKGDENDPPAWFNLGLTRAWLGDNKAALAALDRYLALENDEGRADVLWQPGGATA